MEGMLERADGGDHVMFGVEKILVTKLFESIECVRTPDLRPEVSIWERLFDASITTVLWRTRIGRNHDMTLIWSTTIGLKMQSYRRPDSRLRG